MTRSVVWFRRDLRVRDHLGLIMASGDDVYPLFVLDDRLLSGRFASPRRNAFLSLCLDELDLQLQIRGSRLHIRRGRPEEILPDFAREVGADRVVATRDFTPFARERHDAVQERLRAIETPFWRSQGDYVVEPDGLPFTRTFSAYRRAWLSIPAQRVYAAPDAIRTPRRLDPGPRLEVESFSGLPDPSEAQVVDRVLRFARGPLSDYSMRRDMLAIDGTSGLSAYVRMGVLSPRELHYAATRAHKGPGTDAFLSELCWRDFFAHLLWHAPHVARTAFRPKFANVAWRNDPIEFRAWCEGKTGYPLVDAAMRQLVATGWIHNRARMVAASFLTKHLLCDWRLGEQFFMRHLVDGDVASNNGNWQWVASTGADAQPYFRIFNPVLQGERFDPQGDFVRRWVPELEAVPRAFVHKPWTMPLEAQQAAGCIIGVDYPGPLVDHGLAREAALAAFKAAGK